ncbi:MAG TPA: FAD-dependent oxidoreductase [Candidatus Paceibacterota bacterium]|nr:FAD-dependent oxidoreductase [Candidatus Paceibacterota bacterium]
MQDLIIIGGGPAGIAAGVYAARKYLKTTLITPDYGGQSNVSEGIENWIGTPKISGMALADSLKAHLMAAKSDKVEIVEDTVEKLEKVEGGFKATTKGGKEYSARAVIVASGASRRKLEVPGADAYENKGLTYCASCDGPVFAGQDVAVVGGGNAGFETALQLLAYCKSVTLLSRSGFRADPVSVEKAKSMANFKGIEHALPKSLTGAPFVSSLSYKDPAGEHELPVTGVFVEVGVIPNTGFAKGLLALDEVGRIKVDARDQRTSIEGIWAAGDCTDELYHQNNIAAGDGVKALEDAYLWLMKR